MRVATIDHEYGLQERISPLLYFNRITGLRTMQRKAQKTGRESRQ